MQIEIVSVVSDGTRHEAHATATANDAAIIVAARFEAPVHSDIWQRARDEVLRYLDPM